jgi:Na+-driven multidrug efflux pump
MVLEMVMESIFALVDIYFVSKMGDAAVAVVGLTESLMTVIYSIGVGLAMGTTAIVARRIGEKQDRKASIASEQAILLGIIISAIIAIPGVIFSSRLLEIMHAENKVIEIGQSYTQISWGVISLLYYYLLIMQFSEVPVLLRSHFGYLYLPMYKYYS